MTSQFQGTYRSKHARPTEELSTPSSDDGTPKDYKSMFDSRFAHTKFVDPCEDARKESMRCLDVNNYNRDACTEFFRSYRECKKKWLNQRRDDRRAGKEV